MAKRIHIQHYHSTTGGTPTADNLMMGEIAVGSKAGSEKLFILNSNSGITSFISESQVESKITGKGYATTGQVATAKSEAINASTGYTNTELAKYSETGHTHNASAITAGVLNIERIPTGTSAEQVALGNHTHNYAGSSSAGGAANSANKVNSAITFTSGSTKDFNTVSYSGNTKPTVYIPTKTSHITNDSEFITSGATVAKALVADSVASGNVEGLATALSGKAPNNHASSANTYGLGNSGTTYGHVKLATGDLKNVGYTEGVAAASSHSHSQYLTGYTESYKGTISGVTAGDGLKGGGTKSSGVTGVTLNVGEGTGITVTADAVSISAEYQNKIASGASAYTMVNAFLKDATMTGNAIDTLIEIQNYITSDGQAADEMLSAITSAQTTATSALTEATKYKGTISGVTAGSGLTGGGTNSTGATVVTLNVGAGTGIAVSDDAVSISAEYQNKISSGVTAHGWGNHAEAGYAKKAFKTIKAGDITVVADDDEDTLAINAGSGIEFTGASENSDITIGLASVISCGTF